MDPLLIAVIGVLGTLLAPILNNLVSDRSKRKEFERSQTERLEQAEREENRATRLELRQCYVAFNTAARDYHRALRSWSYAVDNSAKEPAEATEVPRMRQTFQTAVRRGADDRQRAGTSSGAASIKPAGGRLQHPQAHGGRQS